MQYEVSVNGKRHRVDVNLAEINLGDDAWPCRIDGRELLVDAWMIDARTLSLLIDGESYEVRRPSPNELFIRERRYEISIEDPRAWRGKKRHGTSGEGPQKLAASMPGKIVRVLAAEGDSIKAGQGIAVIEAMKMQNEIRSPKEGTLKKLLVGPGTTVNAGEVLAIVE